MSLVHSVAIQSTEKKITKDIENEVKYMAFTVGLEPMNHIACETTVPGPFHHTLRHQSGCSYSVPNQFRSGLHPVWCFHIRTAISLSQTDLDPTHVMMWVKPVRLLCQVENMVATWMDEETKSLLTIWDTDSRLLKPSLANWFQCKLFEWNTLFQV